MFDCNIAAILNDGRHLELDQIQGGKQAYSEEKTLTGRNGSFFLVTALTDTGSFWRLVQCAAKLQVSASTISENIGKT